MPRSVAPARAATVPAFAKINLSLVVLGRRADGFHELRTVFQAVSLSDRVTLRWRPGARWSVRATPEIPNNLAVRAAEAIHQAVRLRGRLEIEIEKRIPMGGGLGGGSSNAAAVLLALPVLAGVRMPEGEVHAAAASLGSDVPFFLEGGAALGLGRGEELYPLQSPSESWGLVVSTGLKVSTAAAYKALGRPSWTELTSRELSNRLNRFRVLAGALCGSGEERDWRGQSENDFEPVVFQRHPQLSELRERLCETGAFPARISGSGSALFGLFRTRRECEKARRLLQDAGAVPIRLLNRREYRAEWLRALRAHRNGMQWPPRSKYENRN
jgi:4-diphosphocytidyl-2-C-methyl-D-erythritol kinase